MSHQITSILWSVCYSNLCKLLYNFIVPFSLQCFCGVQLVLCTYTITTSEVSSSGTYCDLLMFQKKIVTYWNFSDEYCVLSNCTNMSLVNGYRIKCQNYKRMADREKEMRRREEKLGKQVTRSSDLLLQIFMFFHFSWTQEKASRKAAMRQLKNKLKRGMYQRLA